MTSAENKPYVLIALQRLDLAKCLARSFRELTEEYEADVVVSIDSARKRMKKRPYRWLLVDETLPERTGGKRAPEPTATDRSNGVDFAKECLNDPHYPVLRAIVLTDQTWPHLGWRFNARLSGIPKAGGALSEPHFLIDMMRAGEADSIIAPPTTITLDVSREASRVTARLSVDDGPLKRDLIDRIRGRLGSRTVSLCEDFEARAVEFRLAIEKPGAGQSEALIRFAHRLWDGVEPAGALASIFADVLGAAEQMIDRDLLMNGDVSLIHLHVMCEPEMLAMPMDLALPRLTGFPHLCNMLAVSWRVQRHANDDKDTVRRYNPTLYRHFRAVYSCIEQVQYDGLRPFAALPDAHKAICDIVAVLGLAGDCVEHVSDGITLQRALRVSNSVTEGQSGYILTHGLHGQPSDRAGVVVGPKPGTREGDCVTAANLIPDRPVTPRRFLYFNCCELATQETDANSTGSYVGSFLQGLMDHGVCAEAICNRWSVSFEWASFMATEFYRHKAQTAQGRAAALLFARRRTRKAMNPRVDESQFDVSWLAPVHVWGL